MFPVWHRRSRESAGIQTPLRALIQQEAFHFFLINPCLAREISREQYLICNSDMNTASVIQASNLWEQVLDSGKG